jgi:hypothetical protein
VTDGGREERRGEPALLVAGWFASDGGRRRGELDAVVGLLGGSPSSGLGIRFATRGYTFFTNPSASSLLRILGSDDEEQVDTLTDLLRNSSEEEINDLMSRLTQAISRLAEERATGGDPRHRRRSRPDSPSAERRRARRRAGPLTAGSPFRRWSDPTRSGPGTVERHLGPVKTYVSLPPWRPPNIPDRIPRESVRRAGPAVARLRRPAAPVEPAEPEHRAGLGAPGSDGSPGTGPSTGNAGAPGNAGRAGGAGTAGTPGSSGAPGTGPSTGNAGTAGAPGNAGRAGGAGTAGTPGSDGGPGTGPSAQATAPPRLRMTTGTEASSVFAIPLFMRISPFSWVSVANERRRPGATDCVGSF